MGNVHLLKINPFIHYPTLTILLQSSDCIRFLFAIKCLITRLLNSKQIEQTDVAAIIHFIGWRIGKYETFSAVFNQ